MTKYTDEMIDFLKANLQYTKKELAEKFNAEFNLNVSADALAQVRQRRGILTGRTGCFEKGRIPHNKGLKGVCAAGCEKTWFKKGHIPKQHRKTFSERLSKDGYIEIKVAEPNTWKLKHRYVWEQTNGEIPKGNIIIFIDGNKENCNINNLMMISRSEHAIINHNIGAYRGSKELVNATVNTAKLMLSVARKARGD